MALIGCRKSSQGAIRRTGGLGITPTIYSTILRCLSHPSPFLSQLPFPSCDRVFSDFDGEKILNRAFIAEGRTHENPGSLGSYLGPGSTQAPGCPNMSRNTWATPLVNTGGP